MVLNLLIKDPVNAEPRKARLLPVSPQGTEGLGHSLELTEPWVQHRSWAPRTSSGTDSLLASSVHHLVDPKGSFLQ